ncbi:MAG: EamA family transporter, partial [Planctomycetaceae bacterium]|nr:EamA family transporter [Planctomycetaceae bacterium]
LLAFGLLFLHRNRRTGPLIPRQSFLPLLAAALVMQFGGNLGFQLSIGFIGLAITVPLVFALIILSGAVLGRIFLGDSVSYRTAVSILLMTISIILLSHAASQNAKEAPRTPENTIQSGGATDGKEAPEGASVVSAQEFPISAITAVWLGVAIAVISGTAYGINGAVIRGVVRNTLSIEAMLLIYSSTGVLCLGTIGAVGMGWQRLSRIQLQEWSMMAAAGVLNALAFFCITHALKVMNITRVNVINASQNAMCAVAAVLMFGEPQTPSLTIGIVLSIIGLIVLGRR